ncbi:glutaredoxin family protein [Frondihabitans cladoniiphilus]|uniref:Glutaredoxin-like protein DUF836 n=1 Tax=Frondihabitans cladoniiphilus TaxID=715785 RepID=A0ABP8W2S3_9MICO
MPRIELLTKPGCHLCDDARASLAQVLAEDEFAGAIAAPGFAEQNILDDAALTDEYFEDIPVVKIDGRVHTTWRVDQERLRAALRTSLARETDPTKAAS